MIAARTRMAVTAIAVVTALLLTAYALLAPHSGAAVTEVVDPSHATVTLTIRHSRFSPEHLVVRSGTLVHFVIRNDDPIGHEFIVGDDGVHQRHEAGTEPVHPPRPGEVSIAGGATAETDFRFEGTTGSGPVVYACHLPGHYRYGMSGTVDVVSS